VSKSSRRDANDRINAAFHEAAHVISKQLDGSQPGDHESVAYVCQQLSFLMLTNGSRLDVEHSLENLRIFNARLAQQISASQPPKKRVLQ
jgi:hypothetical protein